MLETNPNVEKEKQAGAVSEGAKTLKDIYGSEEEGVYAQKVIQQINADLELREKPSLVFNGVSYSQGYAYNQRKAINYAPPRNPKDDREVSFGIVHEKIISFVATFLKYVFKRRIKCYDNGQIVKGMGKIYDLAIEYSHNLEQFKKKIALIYWEVFTQGNAFVFEDWEVKNDTEKVALKDGKVLLPEEMDYTYEFLDNLTYRDGEKRQVRRAVSRVLDGRKVIFGNPEIEEVQEQPRITLENALTRADAEAIYGTLKRWAFVPKSKQEIDAMVGKATTLFDANRHKNPEDVFIEHIVWDKESNRFNTFLNGVMMLNSKTPFTLFYPRGNYPLSNVPCERLRGSIYARSIPAKTKFNADYLDFVLKNLANKFEQGVDPAILSRGKYTLTRDMFRGGQVTHGVSREDFEKADPENKGITNNEVSFATMIKQIIEAQTVNQVTSGELSNSATATEIATVDNNQKEKLGFLLDGLVGGFMDMSLRRAETIEAKYTIKQRETIVDGKKVSVYQDFTINVGGTENIVQFDEQVGGEGYNAKAKRDELFTKAFNDKKKGYPTEYFLVNPKKLRDKRYTIIMEILPERIKDNQLQMIQMWDEFTQLTNLFGKASEGGSLDMKKLQELYLETSGRPDDLFVSDAYKELETLEKTATGGGAGAYNMGSMGKPTAKPTVKGALKSNS